MSQNFDNFIQQNSPDGGFLQSDEWRKFQEAVGRRTFLISGDKDVKPQSGHVPSFHASVIEHKLPLVGKYFYIPRGPIISADAEKFSIFNFQFSKIIELAKKENAGWIRIDPANNEILKGISNVELSNKKGSTLVIKKAPHDMQPREIFAIDIAKSEERLLSEMKPKTRYNIRLAEKKGVKILKINNNGHPELVSGSGGYCEEMLKQVQHDSRYYLDEFLRLVKVTAERDGITPHPDEYYRKMFETIPAENLKLYLAEYRGKIIAANLVSFYGNTATYLHGASDNNHRNIMAPYLLQWRTIQDAKKIGCAKYDFGGIKSATSGKRQATNRNDWQGITRFKLGFSPDTKSIEFPGSYDIVIKPAKYRLYKIIQKIKRRL